MMTFARLHLKARLIHERGRLCENCGHRKATDLDEIIISRGDVAGNARLTQMVTEAEMNVCLTCRRCNTAHAGRQELRAKLLRRYGAKAVGDWIISLGLKNPNRYLQSLENT